MDGSPRSERLRLRFARFGEAALLRGRYAPEPGGFNDFGVDVGPSPRPGTAPPPPETQPPPPTATEPPPPYDYP